MKKKKKGRFCRCFGVCLPKCCCAQRNNNDVKPWEGGRATSVATHRYGGKQREILERVGCGRSVAVLEVTEGWVRRKQFGVGNALLVMRLL